MTGKILPQAIDLEEAILGALMLEKYAVEQCSDLKSEMFFKQEHRYIYDSILSLIKKNNPVDILSVQTELNKNGKLQQVGGVYYIAKLTSRVSSAANINYHSKVVIEKYIQREIINLSAIATGKFYDDNIDVFEEKNKLVSSLEKLGQVNVSKTQSLQNLVIEKLKKLTELQENNSHITGIDTGYYKLNNITSGWQPTDLIILGARPGTGKTTFALNLVKNLILNKVECGIFSLEMSSEQLVSRLMSSISDIEASKIKNASLNEYDWNKLNGVNWNLPLWIDDSAALSIIEFKNRARKMVRDKGVKYIVVDYLQLMTTHDKGNREQQLGDISRGLKQAAKELNVPIIALSQLSRDIEKKEREPVLSDLRESGSIEQDADIVIFLHSKDKTFSDTPPIEVIFAKNRAGSVGKLDYIFYKINQKFTELI